MITAHTTAPPETKRTMSDDTPSPDDAQPAWPFPDIPPEVYWSLPEADRAGLEQIIRDMIDGTNSKY